MRKRLRARFAGRLSIRAGWALILSAGVMAHANPDWLVVQQVEVMPNGYLPVDIGAWLEGGEVQCADSIKSRPLQMDADPPERGIDLKTLIATHAGDHLVYAFAAADSDSKSWQWGLVHRHLDTGKEQTIELAAWQPTSLHVHRDSLYLGVAEWEDKPYGAMPTEIAIGRIALDSDAPSLNILTRRSNKGNLWKAYDLIIREDNYLIAVDDIVEPFYADSFRIESNDALTHLAGWRLPSLVNGHYRHGALLQPGSKTPTLFLVSAFSLNDGWGYHLMALALQPDSLSVPPSARRGYELHQLQRAGRLLEEQHPRGPGEHRLLAGTAFTPWLGFARIQDQLVIAAGERGLMVIPATFTSTTKATLIDLGEPCIDVVRRGDALVALTGQVPQGNMPMMPSDQPSTLHLLRVKEQGIESVSSFLLPGKNCRRLLK